MRSRKSNKISAERRCFLEEEFEELQERVSNPHARSDVANDTQREVEKYLKEFLMAGFNATRVSGLLSCENRLKHHRLLTEYKAKINIVANVRKAGRDFLQKNWDKLIQLKGITTNLLAEAFIGDKPVVSINDLNFLIRKGVSEDILFNGTIELKESLEEIEAIKNAS